MYIRDYSMKFSYLWLRDITPFKETPQKLAELLTLRAFEIESIEKVGKDYVLEVRAPRQLMKYIVEKGSIAVDGISLTVAAFGRDWFRVWIIPHTRAITNLRCRQVGEPVNLEADMLAKHLERFLKARRG